MRSIIMVMQSLATQQEQIETLTRINLQDFLDNFGLSKLQRGRHIVERVFWSPAQSLARQVTRLDQRVGDVGLQIAGSELLRQYIHRLDIVGAENIPAQGGVLFASNHPGMTDTLACFAGIPRSDLRVISNDRPFLRALPNIAARLFFVDDDATKRMTVVRQVTRYLQNGGAVMICPAGEIEPDPAVMPGAIEWLSKWSDSLGLFVRTAPNCVVVPTVISGVVHAHSLYNPIAQSRKTQRDREKIGATIQAALMTAGYLRRKLDARIEFGAPLSARDLIARGDAIAITHAITDATKPLIERVMPSHLQN
jgi:hypothetical protein